MKSIRVFLVVVTLAVITLFFFITGLHGYRSSMLEAERLFDKQLLDTARLIANIHAESTARNIGSDASLAFQVWNGDRLLATSRNSPAEPISERKPGFGYSNFAGYRWRTAAYFDPSGENWILVADRMDLRYSLAENVILESLVPTVAGLPVVALLIWLIVSGGLRPLSSLARQLSQKQPDDLSPVSVVHPRNELQQIVSSVNGLLQRLETSLLRERQFASDAAHELRTPISALKLQVYNLQQESNNEPSAVAELLATADRLDHIVEQILDLYRSSPDQYNAQFQTLRLDNLVREVLAEKYGMFAAKNQQIEFSGDPVELIGDRFALETLLQNLLSNASKYTPADGQIRVSLEANSTNARLVVEDSGPGIPEQHRQEIFARFYRLGGDRGGSDAGGCGLGLAIVQRLVELHRGRIRVESSANCGGAAFVVTLPLQPVGHP